MQLFLSHSNLSVVQYFSNMVSVERFAYHLRAAITYALNLASHDCISSYAIQSNHIIHSTILAFRVNSLLASQINGERKREQKIYRIENEIRDGGGREWNRRARISIFYPIANKEAWTNSISHCNHWVELTIMLQFQYHTIEIWCSFTQHGLWHVKNKIWTTP